MKIIVVSDNHYEHKVLNDIRIRHLQEAELFIHCGDSQLPFEHDALTGYLTVRGNCDYNHQFPKERLEQLDEKSRLFATHGHLYDVKYTMDRLYNKALEVGAHVVCYGHSHFIEATFIDGILFVNPGSVTFPRNTKEKTYARLTVHQEAVKVEFLEAASGHVLLVKSFKR